MLKVRNFGENKYVNNVLCLFFRIGGNSATTRDVNRLIIRVREEIEDKTGDNNNAAKPAPASNSAVGPVGARAADGFDFVDADEDSRFR